jgi:ABC-type nickel/cobalt efflux system permease component RcnA
MILLKIFSSFQPLGLFYFQSSDDSSSGMACCVVPVAVILVIGAIAIWKTHEETANKRRREQEETADMSPEEKAQYHEKKRAEKQKADKIAAFGHTSPAMICPHCQTKGQVRTKKISQKKGVSGAKATGAILTGGVSLLATGLSRKEDATQAHCDNCNSTWYF